MFNLDKFIADSVTKRPVSMFAADIEANKEILTREINGKKVCVIGGAGSIGSSFIKAVLRFEPKGVVVVDLNENGLAELVRDVRSTDGLFVPDEFRCYTLNFADPIFERIFREEKGFDIVANFSAHKHVRSEKDKYSVQALIENNDIKAKKLMDLLTVILIISALYMGTTFFFEAEHRSHYAFIFPMIIWAAYGISPYFEQSEKKYIH